MSFYEGLLLTLLGLLIITDLSSAPFAYNDCPLDTQTDLFPKTPDIKEQKTALVTKYVANRTAGPEQKIPFNIFQTNQYDMIPWKMKYSVNSLLEKNPEYTYRFFNGTERRQFIEKQMGETILKCYDKLIPNAYKADLWRYSVVYTYGGCYIDIGFMAAAPISTLINSTTTFLSTVDDVVGKYALNSAFFCTTPNNKILQKTINLIVKSVYKQEYGIDPIDMTGPRKFAAGFLSYFESENITTTLEPRFYGPAIQIIFRSHEDGCLQSTFDSLDGRVIFYSKYPDYDLDMNWYTKRPKYWAHWHNRTVFDKSISFAENTSEFSIENSGWAPQTKQDFRVPKQFKHL